MEFKKIIDNINSIKIDDSIKFSDECYYLINNEDVIIKYNGNNKVSNLVEFYKERYDIQRNITESKSIIGYRELILELEKLDVETYVYIVHLYFNSIGYILFFQKNNDKLLFILKNYNMKIQKEEELNDFYYQRGYNNENYRIKQSKK